MKKSVYLMMVLTLASCTDQQLADEVIGECVKQKATREVVAVKKDVTTNDAMLEADIKSLLQEEVAEHKKWSKAMVYVVETNTGKIKASVGLKRKGENFIPCTDDYEQEQSVMECGPVYLALLSSGKITPKQQFDTGCGIYGEVKDHNWRNGGFGEISLERALEVRSQVAFTMAKESTFGDNLYDFEAKMNSYLAGKPNTAMGLLTFYNGVANGGRMMELVSEGEGGIVLQEQMAQPQHIKTLQTGLERCVTHGVMRKAGRESVKVAACGRTFDLPGGMKRMELCGYFHSENPHYTIMVIQEKKGLPASAGGMCGPIFARIVDLLLENS